MNAPYLPVGKDAELTTPALVTPARETTEEVLFSPGELRCAYPTTPNGSETVRVGRAALRRALRMGDRFVVVVGPCSIHDTHEALEYAQCLRELQTRVGDSLLLVMRVYGEKPRTTLGWKGLVNDPYLDGSFDMAEGMRRMRSLLVQIADLGLPVATEVLDPAVPPYLSDLLTFAAIGARTTESQTHRALASGLPCPVGFKNGTDGSVQVALDACLSARAPHGFLATNDAGRICSVRTGGNPDTLLILRGGKNTGPNYAAPAVRDAADAMERAELTPSILVDCSHANSGYNPAQQKAVCEDIARQKQNGTRALVGVMLESNLEGGKQSLPPFLTPGVSPALRPGVSITDGCLGWPETEALLLDLAEAVG